MPLYQDIRSQLSLYSDESSIQSAIDAAISDELITYEEVKSDRPKIIKHDYRIPLLKEALVYAADDLELKTAQISELQGKVSALEAEVLTLKGQLNINTAPPPDILPSALLSRIEAIESQLGL